LFSPLASRLSPTSARIVGLSSSALKLAAILAKLAAVFSGSRVNTASWPRAKKPRAWATRELRFSSRRSSLVSSFSASALV